jgi:hypothetical protein
VLESLVLGSVSAFQSSIRGLNFGSADMSKPSPLDAADASPVGNDTYISLVSWRVA